MNRSLLDVLKSLLYAAWRRRYLIVMPFLFMIPVGILGSKLAPKTFEAKTLLLLQETGLENPFLKDFAIGLNVKDRISALQTLIKSEHILRAVVEDASDEFPNHDPESIQRDIARLAGNVSLQLVGTNMLELRLRGARPNGLGKLLKVVTNRFLERLLAPEQSALGASQTFLADQLAIRRKQLDDAEQELVEFKLKHVSSTQAIHMTEVTRLGALRQRLQDKTVEMSNTTMAVGEMRSQIANSSPIIGKLEEGIVQTTAELTSLKAKYTDEHSEVQAMERRLQSLLDERRSYLDAFSRIKDFDLDKPGSVADLVSQKGDKSAPPLLVSQLLRLQDTQSKHNSLESETQQLRIAVTELQKDIAGYSPIEQRAERLEKSVIAKRENYENFVKRYDNATTSRALGLFEAPERVKVIDAPQDPAAPIGLPRIVFAIGGMLAGIILGIGLAIVSELLDQHLRTARDIREITSLSIIASLPRGIYHDAGDVAPA